MGVCTGVWDCRGQFVHDGAGGECISAIVGGEVFVLGGWCCYVSHHSTLSYPHELYWQRMLCSGTRMIY